MANIDIKDLETSNLDRNDLFTDSESFMVELNDSSDRNLILGGNGIEVLPDGSIIETICPSNDDPC